MNQNIDINPDNAFESKPTNPLDELDHTRYISRDIHVVMIPEVFVQLEIELEQHPDIEIGQHEMVYDRINDLAVQLEVVLDGYYSEQDMVGLAEVLLQKLIQKRGGILVLNGSLS